MLHTAITYPIARIGSLLAWTTSNVLEVLLNDVELLAWLPGQIALCLDVAVSIHVIIHASVASSFSIAHRRAILERVDIGSPLDGCSHEIRVRAELITHAACTSVGSFAIGACVKCMGNPAERCRSQQRCRDCNHIVGSNERMND